MQSRSTIKIHHLPNGITLLGEEMDFVRSGAFSILVPIGAASDPDGCEGAAGILAEMFHKGAGPWDTRALSEQFEEIGAHRSHSAGIEVSVFSGAVLGDNLPKVLELYSTVLLEPRFPADELESVRQLALQELSSLEDHPSSKVMVELAKRFYPHPFGRSQLGTVEGVNALDHEQLVHFYRSSFVPERAIIAIAGKFDWEAVKNQVEHCFARWSGVRKPHPQGKLSDSSSAHHLAKETNQVQIALAYPSVAADHPDYAVARVAVGLLSGGMAGRLFIEVREKRGLVYRISASHSATKGRAAVFVYAGTTPENAEETLAVTLEQLRGLKDGITDEELLRTKADLKSKIVMQGESTFSRAGALVNDWWHLGRVRSLEEIKLAIDAVTAEDIRRHLTQFPISPITLVTLGNKPLGIPG